MRFDIISVFPEFFSVLDLSLVGKARARGIIDFAAHDLREWTTDVHRTVDDSPFGGGAGMVMKPDVWGQAIDDVVAAGRCVLAIPTPSGIPLTQATCWELAKTDQVIIACGRYEGIDARVAEYYRRSGMEVAEYSLGDYVLNGGEVAAIALVEGVARLLPGMVGNPESLREESHGEAGLLEYPVYTRPTTFRGIEVPEVLTSGDHGKVARWRRDLALERTAQRRPDMIRKLEAATLDKKDRAKLVDLGWVVGERPERVEVCQAKPDDATAVSEVARRLFPHACPPGMSSADIDSYLAHNLMPEHIAAYIDDPRYLLLLARIGNAIAGYSLAFFPASAADHAELAAAGAPVDAVLDGVVRDGSLVYLSRMYVDVPWRGKGVFDILMGATLASIRERADGPEPYVWLGTSATNRRAIRAYRRVGFTETGAREFRVGEQINKDVTLAIRAGVSQL
ncbi:tRNA (guanosine(37)-N1)-methyltransferase TrmD [Trueperella pyogenes]|uniref:tRNA (guanosine(37)-N1)-methyltransferase TrmD n=1 Tax=Trueperella pyogenes TaxID=1661 RepID=UPI00345DC33E